MTNILEIKNLNKNFKNFSLKNISFSLPKGYIMGFIGPNGAGKTTIIKTIMNLVRKDSGEIDIFGKDNIKYESEVKKKIGFVYDEDNFYDYLSLEDNAKLISPFYSTWDFNKFYDYLNRFGLDKTQRIKELSKGMKMKFSIALALCHNPQFIIMDEPTSGLDPVIRNEILDILREEIQNENIGILLSTHITSDLEKIADYITYINDGRIVFSKSVDEILDTYKIVKGDSKLLNYKSEKMFCGIRKTIYGFEGLTFEVDKVRKEFGDKVSIENATLQSIMVLKRK